MVAWGCDCILETWALWPWIIYGKSVTSRTTIPVTYVSYANNMGEGILNEGE